MAEAPAHHAAAFGLRWVSDIPLAHFQAIGPSGECDVRVARAAGLPRRESGTPVRRGHVYADGTRFPWEREAVFDTWAGCRVDYVPGPDWTGVLPSAFYGTVAAHLLAWRGLLPFHACAVEVGGKAVLIAGAGGAGKSSLMAGLLSLGAPLVSDDLTAVAIGGGIEALPGRTTVRLGEAVAQWTVGAPCEPPSPATRGKHVIRPALRTRAGRLPLAGMLCLGVPPGEVPAVARGAVLAAHLFRPAWLAALPGHRARQQKLLVLAAQLPVIGFPAVARAGRDAHLERAHAALALARTLAGL